MSGPSVSSNSMFVFLISMRAPPHTHISGAQGLRRDPLAIARSLTPESGFETESSLPCAIAPMCIPFSVFWNFSIANSRQATGNSDVMLGLHGSRDIENLVKPERSLSHLYYSLVVHAVEISLFAELVPSALRPLCDSLHLCQLLPKSHYLRSKRVGIVVAQTVSKINITREHHRLPAATCPEYTIPTRILAIPPNPSKRPPKTSRIPKVTRQEVLRYHSVRRYSAV